MSVTCSELSSWGQPFRTAWINPSRLVLTHPDTTCWRLAPSSKPLLHPLSPSVFSDIGMLLLWCRLSPLWQDFTTQTFLSSTNFHNADWKWCAGLLRKLGLQCGELPVLTWCFLHEYRKKLFLTTHTLLEWLCAWFILTVVDWSGSHRKQMAHANII